jgi:hypothetical protein
MRLELLVSSLTSALKDIRERLSWLEPIVAMQLVSSIPCCCLLRAFAFAGRMAGRRGWCFASLCPRRRCGAIPTLLLGLTFPPTVLWRPVVIVRNLNSALAERGREVDGGVFLLSYFCLPLLRVL